MAPQRMYRLREVGPSPFRMLCQLLPRALLPPTIVSASLRTAFLRPVICSPALLPRRRRRRRRWWLHVVTATSPCHLAIAMLSRKRGHRRGRGAQHSGNAHSMLL